MACNSGSRPAGIGSPAPDFTVQDGDRIVSLHDYRGKVVILHFWATWCPPCIEEMPSLMQLQNRLRDRVTVLAISMDMDQNAYYNFIRDHKVDLSHGARSRSEKQRAVWHLQVSRDLPDRPPEARFAANSYGAGPGTIRKSNCT